MNGSRRLLAPIVLAGGALALSLLAPSTSNHPVAAQQAATNTVTGTAGTATVGTPDLTALALTGTPTITVTVGTPDLTALALTGTPTVTVTAGTPDLTALALTGTPATGTPGTATTTGTPGTVVATGTISSADLTATAAATGTATTGGAAATATTTTGTPGPPLAASLIEVHRTHGVTHLKWFTEESARGYNVFNGHSRLNRHLVTSHKMVGANHVYTFNTHVVIKHLRLVAVHQKHS